MENRAASKKVRREEEGTRYKTKNMPSIVMQKFMDIYSALALPIVELIQYGESSRAEICIPIEG